MSDPDQTRPAASTTIIGNVYPKYTTRNPIARCLMQGFLSAVEGLHQGVAPRSVLEVERGEYVEACLLEPEGHAPGTGE
ncbi:MAG: hypothetical protein H0T47_15420 [Planctomycetaceae bacterium]|nr:hypothetical protein [Planctomycetaceae bacterium]